MAPDEHETNSFWGALLSGLKNPAVAVVSIGAFLALASAFPNLPYAGAFGGGGWRQFIAVTGVIIVITGLWKLLGTPRASNETPSANRYGLRIEVPSPTFCSPVARKIRVEGSCKKTPPPGSLMVVEKSPSTSKFWLKPQSPEFSDDKKRWWFSDVYVGGNAGDERVISVGVMGDSGKAFRDYYLLVRSTFEEPVATPALPRDISLGPQVTVRQTEPDVPIPAGGHESYGMTIDWPPNPAVVGAKVQLRGSYINKPPQDSLLIYENNLEDGEYWFKQEKPVFDEINKKWSTVIYIGAGTGERILHVAMTGEGGKVARNYCKAAYDRTERWVPLENPPSDIQTLAQVTVKYSANEKLHTRP